MSVRFAHLWCVALLSVSQAGCEPAEPVDLSPSARVVCLAPALTHLLVALGRESLVVGVGQSDVSAPDTARVVGTFMDINAEALISLAPTHVVGMFGDLGGDTRLAALAASGAFELVSYPYPRSAADVLRLLRPATGTSTQGDVSAVPDLGTLLGLDRDTRVLAQRVESVLAAVVEATGSRPRPRVLMLFDVETLMAAGPGEVLDDLLTRYAGATNAAEAASVAAPTFDREKLVAVNPEVIVLLNPGGPPFGTVQTDTRLAVLRNLPIAAVRDGRVVEIRDPFVLYPSSSIGRTAALLAQAVHGPLPALEGILHAR